jgi:hypothetical protein
MYFFIIMPIKEFAKSVWNTCFIAKCRSTDFIQNYKQIFVELSVGKQTPRFIQLILLVVTTGFIDDSLPQKIISFFLSIKEIIFWVQRM